jgi:hypothetical protein
MIGTPSTSFINGFNEGADGRRNEPSVAEHILHSKGRQGGRSKCSCYYIQFYYIQLEMFLVRHSVIKEFTHNFFGKPCATLPNVSGAACEGVSKNI